MKLNEIFEEVDLAEKIFPSMKPPRSRLGKPLRKEKIKPKFTNQKTESIIESILSLRW